jgi:hypothetical protein
MFACGVDDETKRLGSERFLFAAKERCSLQANEVTDSEQLHRTELMTRVIVEGIWQIGSSRVWWWIVTGKNP